jgi:putative spermidine/putrescine transport system permease protein
VPRLVTAVVFAPVLLPPFAAALGINVLLLRAQVPALAGLVLVLVAMALPYTTFSMRAAYAAHDLGYEEEARTLGASRARVLWQVHVPLLAPALARSAFLAFLVGWSDYIITVMVGGGQIVTLPLITASAASGVGNDALVAALSLAAVIPPVLLLLVLVRGDRRMTP